MNLLSSTKHTSNRINLAEMHMVEIVSFHSPASQESFLLWKTFNLVNKTNRILVGFSFTKANASWDMEFPKVGQQL